MIHWESDDGCVHRLGKIDAKGRDKSRLVANVVLPRVIREIISAYETSLLYLRKNFNKINRYSLQHVVPVDIGEVQRVVWDAGNHFFRPFPDADFQHRLDTARSQYSIPKLNSRSGGAMRLWNCGASMLIVIGPSCFL